jgi:hypothetical protein
VHGSADSADALNVPAAQAATLVPEPVKPASAKQPDSATEPVVVTVVFGGHVSHVSDVCAVAFLNFPDEGEQSTGEQGSAGDLNLTAATPGGDFNFEL